MRHVAYSDLDDVQHGGLGDWEITVEARVTSRDTLRGLITRQDGASYPLTDFFDEDFDAALLMKAEEPQRWQFGDQLKLKLTFRRPAEAAVSSGAAPVAHFTPDVSVAGEVTIDPNGSTSPTGFIDAVNLEFGDSSIWTANGPWPVGAVSPIVHAYASAGPYQINMSVVAGGVTSGDDSQNVTIS